MDGTTIATLYFGHDLFLLDSRNLEALEKVGEERGFVLDPIISVDGYASSEGTADYNLKLSENRRSTVVALLRSRVVGTATFGGSAHGESMPATEESAKGGPKLKQERGLNRRVTIVVFARTATKPTEEKKKPIDLTLHQPPPETEEEKRRRELFRPGPTRPPQPTLSEAVWKKFDETIDDVSRSVGIPKKYRGYVRDAAHAAVEKGADAALDQALGAANLTGPQKDAIKSAIKASAKTLGETKIP
jgi:hypothetical protein